MTQKLMIILDEETTHRYLLRVGRKTQAEVDSDCLPSGCSLTVVISPPFGNTVYYGDEDEIGEATVILIDDSTLLPS